MTEVPNRRAVAPAVRLTDISKAYGGAAALDRASLTVEPTTIHALLGGNGSGKSTMIKILAGVVKADAGEIEIGGTKASARTQTPTQARDLGLHFVHQQSSTFPELSVAENLAIGRGFEHGVGGRIRWRALRKRAAEVIERFEIEARPETEVGTMGAANQTLVAIARALQDQENAHDGVLALDEPTASLPRHEVELLLSALQRYADAGQTIIYVTHRLEEVVRIADKATVLRDGQVAAILEKDEIDQETLASHIVVPGLEREASPKASAHRDNVSGGGGSDKTVILESQPADPGERGLVVRSGEIVGIAGLLGSGRTTLLRQLFGSARGELTDRQITLDGAQVSVPGPREAMAHRIAYVPENRKTEASFSELSLSENMSIANLSAHARIPGVMDSRHERADARRLMEDFMIRAESERAPLSSLSGGNQQKVILARWLQREPLLMLLDEPTQGVDVGARAEIHQMIRRSVAAGAGALVVSSDFEELAMLCDTTLILREGRVVDELSGNELTEDALNQACYADMQPS